MSTSAQKTVLLSEPHLWNSPIRVGGHHYAREFMKDGWRVVFITYPSNALALFRSLGSDRIAERVRLWRRGGDVFEDGQLICYAPMSLLPIGRRLPGVIRSHLGHFLIPTLRTFLRSHGIEQVDLLWLTGAVDGYLLKAVPHRWSFARINDDYGGFRTYPGHLETQLHNVIRSVGIAACTSEPLRRKLVHVRPDIILLRNGVEYEHFARDGFLEPLDLRSIPRPRVMYIGAIAYWFDWSLVADVAGQLADVHFVIIGPESESTKAPNVRTLQNVHVLGKRPYETLPAYLSHADVGIVPFVRSQLVNSVSPIKVYEYLAAGLPVVSTWWEELEASQAPVRLAHSPDQFIEHIMAALGEGRTKRERYREFASQQSWASRYQRVKIKLQQAISCDDGFSGRRRLD